MQRIRTGWTRMEWELRTRKERKKENAAKNCCTPQAMKPCLYTTSSGIFILHHCRYQKLPWRSVKTVGHNNDAVLFIISCWMRWSTGIVSHQHCENTFRCPLEHFLDTLFFNYIMDKAAGECRSHQIIIYLSLQLFGDLFFH